MKVFLHTSFTLLTTSLLIANYPIVDTDQVLCYDSTLGMQESCTNAGYDADHEGNQASYTLSDSGLTVLDNVTGLRWTQSTDLNGDSVLSDANDKLSQSAAIAYCSDLALDGYEDWRLPDIKTQYSLILFTGEDPSGYEGTDTSGLVTFLDASFTRSFGDTNNDERVIDAQYATTTSYVSTTMNGDLAMFGVNFVDGRIKGYPQTDVFYVHCVRGDESYGVNDFTDNFDGTISDASTSLMWEQDDSTSSDWDHAISICENSTTANYEDWRLPDAKELQSIVDYTRSPNTTDSPAIDAVFNASSFFNEDGVKDWGYYWSSTTHVNSSGYGDNAVYLSFGRALGYIPINDDSGPGDTPEPVSGIVLDVHGAGSQRSNGKISYGSEYSSATAYDGSTFYYKGFQGDILRLNNKVRCIRDNSESNNYMNASILMYLLN